MSCVAPFSNFLLCNHKKFAIFYFDLENIAHALDHSFISGQIKVLMRLMSVRMTR